MIRLQPWQLGRSSLKNSSMSACMATISAVFLVSAKPVAVATVAAAATVRLRCLPLLKASASALPFPINADYLATEFNGHGVSFEGVGDDCVLKMEVENGSAAHLLLPAGIVTSYKPHMWHGGTAELLHTAVSEGLEGEPLVQGGMSMEFECAGSNGWLWSPRHWAPRDVTGDSAGDIKVELASYAPEKVAEARCTVALHRHALSLEFTIQNNSFSPLHLSGAAISHLTVSTPDAVYATTLQGSSYHSRRPMASQFCIVPPGFKKACESQGEEEYDTTCMAGEMCRIYTSAPQEFMVIDKGRRNSISIGTRGFEEVYVMSPGSRHEWYGKFSYICIGPATPKPVTVPPQGIWEGAIYLLNPNG